MCKKLEHFSTVRVSSVAKIGRGHAAHGPFCQGRFSFFLFRWLFDAVFERKGGHWHAHAALALPVRPDVSKRGGLPDNPRSAVRARPRLTAVSLGGVWGLCR